MADEARTNCPADETLALWCERKLVGVERRDVESHLVMCDRCRQVAIAVCVAMDSVACDNEQLLRGDTPEATESQDVDAIFRGRRARIVRRTDVRVVLDLRTDVSPLVEVQAEDRDLILNPTADDLALADMFERGDISAFEYPDGHTYPPNREIRHVKTRFRTTIH